MDFWKQLQLPRSEIDKLRAEVKIASAALDAARRKLVNPTKPTQKGKATKDKHPPSSS